MFDIPSKHLPTDKRQADPDWLSRAIT